jgi:ADP-heptose:LPS heptosyltransferase
VALGQQVQRQYGPFIVVEPTAERKHVNRRPPRAFWTFLVEQLQGSLALVQLAHPDAEMLPGLIPLVHADFREACGILAASQGLVATEGGLVHAAAALGVPTVALFGGCISVEALGYPEHVNLVDDSPETPCGALKPCDHCVRAWERISPTMTAQAVQEMLRKAA